MKTNYYQAVETGLKNFEQRVSLKKVDIKRLSNRPTRTKDDLDILGKIQILIGFSGKMYLPTLDELVDEGFEMVRPYLITSSHTPQQVLDHWNNNGKIFFDEK